MTSGWVSVTVDAGRPGTGTIMLTGPGGDEFPVLRRRG